MRQSHRVLCDLIRLEVYLIQRYCCESFLIGSLLRHHHYPCKYNCFGDLLSAFVLMSTLCEAFRTTTESIA